MYVISAMLCSAIVNNFCQQIPVDYGFKLSTLSSTLELCKNKAQNSSVRSLKVTTATIC